MTAPKVLFLPAPDHYVGSEYPAGVLCMSGG